MGFPLKVRGVDSQQLTKAVEDIASQVHMSEYLHRFPRELSGGQRQRVALGRAMIRRPAAFLMDEPLSNLDAKLRGHMRAELKHMQSELGTTTIYVTHDQIEAMTLAHRVAIMNEGVLQQLGTPREVYDNPATLFVAGFMGSPPMNFVNGEISDQAFSITNSTIPVTVNTACSKATLGFRPEDARVVNAGEGIVDAMVYTTEQTGEYTLITATIEQDTVIVKMPRDFDAPPHSTIGIQFPAEKAMFFDTVKGNRVDITLL